MKLCIKRNIMKVAVQAMLLYLGSQNVETQYMGYLKTVTQYLEVSNKLLTCTLPYRDVESTPSLGFYYEWCIHLSYVEVFQKRKIVMAHDSNSLLATFPQNIH